MLLDTIVLRELFIEHVYKLPVDCIRAIFFLWYTQNLAEENVALKININKEKIVTVSAA